MLERVNKTASQKLTFGEQCPSAAPCAYPRRKALLVLPLTRTPHLSTSLDLRSASLFHPSPGPHARPDTEYKILTERKLVPATEFPIVRKDGRWNPLIVPNTRLSADPTESLVFS